MWGSKIDITSGKENGGLNNFSLSAMPEYQRLITSSFLSKRLHTPVTAHP